MDKNIADEDSSYFKNLLLSTEQEHYNFGGWRSEATKYLPDIEFWNCLCTHSVLEQIWIKVPYLNHSIKPYTLAIALISTRIKILHTGKFFTKWYESECNYCKVAFALVKISFWKISIVEPNLGDFNSCWF